MAFPDPWDRIAETSMRHVLFIHGGGGGAFEADAALADSLRRRLGAAYEVRYPRMPDEEEPDYPTWRRLILEQVAEMGDGAILAGHSIGASVLARVMTDDDPPRAPMVAGVFVASAPFWHDHDFWRWDAVRLPENPAELWPADVPLFLYHGDQDRSVPVEHLEMYARALPQAEVRRLPGRDHQLGEEMGEMAGDVVGLVQR